MVATAVILAGGIGTRVGLGIPKQLIKIAGKAIVEHTLEAFERNDHIDEIIIMMDPATIQELDHLLKSSSFKKLSKVLPGGSTRNHTTKLALNAIKDDNRKVLFHDAVRPFINDRIINECIAALDQYDAVDTAIPSADTIIEVDARNCISNIPSRSTLRRGQTPQAFRAGTLRKAYEHASKDSEFQATDDCGVVFDYLPESKIYVVRGNAENMKITEAIDIHIADKIFQLQSSTVDIDSDNLPDLTAKTVVVIGGSYGIGKSTADLCRDAGANVFSFSRSLTGTDATQRDSIYAALRQVLDTTQQIDHVILTAGCLNISPLASASDEDIQETVATNLIAPALVAQEAFPHLKKTRGSLTLFTSSSYTRGRAGYALYSATKAGVVNLSQALSEEWAEAGVRINAINPQRTATPMRTAAFGEEPDETLLSPAAVANATVAVIESKLTGQVVNVRLH